MRALLLVVGTMAATLVAGCETTCIPTTTTATDARKLDLVTPDASSTLPAMLMAEGAPLAGRILRFDVQDDGASVYSDDATTSRTGTASYDLKRVDAQALAAIVRGNGFVAAFAGDGTYCASSDEAGFKVVRAPVPLPVDPG